MTRLHTTILLLISCMVIQVQNLKITGPVSSVNFGPDSLPIRHEINEFVRSGPPFDLYILALQQFQAQTQSEMLSYFQVAGIHGYPLRSWDGVGGIGQYPGYCMHASVLFPTWHRPYLALFEQVIWNHAQDIARTYPLAQRDEYQASAVSLRVPYWDWAVHPELPAAAVSPTIAINSPGGQTELPNPLLQYNFHPGQEGNGFSINSPLANLSHTVRHYNLETGYSNNSAATAVLLANAPSTLALTYQILASVDNYTAFSCTSPGGQSSGPYNIENLHNGIHTFVGGLYGHMTYPQLAAFDPVFWLHHANVDRVFALWQALNPGSYVSPTVNPYGSYYEAPNTIESAQTYLAPFHADNGTTLFTSDGARDLTIFGYTYAELSNRSASPSEVAAFVRSKINQLYAPQTAGVPGRRGLDMVGRAPNIEQAFSHVDFDMTRDLEVNNLERQWSISIAVHKISHIMPYSIDFFIGKQPPLSLSATAPNLIGTYGQFSVADDLVTPREDDPHGIIYGGLSMTHVLAAGVARGCLEDLSPLAVLPVLRDYLGWQARTEDGCAIDLADLKGLVITVQSRQVRQRSSVDEFPIYGETETHPEATRCKIGGFEDDAAYEGGCESRNR